MPCPSDSTFAAFAADQLPLPLEQQIAEHLERCAVCRQRADALCGGQHLQAAKHAGGTRGTLMGDATCAEPPDLCTGLYRLASSDASPELAMPPSGTDLFRLLTAETTDDIADVRLGRFTIQRWLGAGSFGVVFLAYDERLRRQVALKLPRIHWLTRQVVRERFFREAEAAAQLHHPGVVPVYEAGEEQGICYIASAYCPGPTLDVWLAEQTGPVAVATAATLSRQLAEAVHHAHQHRILHRDIKPSNILLEPHPDDPQVRTPKITDFGLAKLLDTDSTRTASHGMLGTPRYMAPEQAAGSRGAVGPATDVFALGAVLYELLTGVAPYAGEDQARTLHRLLYEPVVTPRRLRSEVPRDLEAICLKCLEKQPAARYPAAQDLADDLRRFEEGRATLARPVGRLELLRRWTIRQPAVASLLAVITLSLLGTLGVFIAYSRSLESWNREARTAQHAMEDQRAQMREMLYALNLKLAHQALQENDLRQASHLLEEARTAYAEVPRGFVWHYLWNQMAASGELVDAADADIYELRFTASGSRLAAGGADSVLRVYNGRSFAMLASWPTGQGEINGLAFSPDERTIASAGDDGTIHLWETATGKLLRTIQADSGMAFGVLFTRDGRSLITCGEDPVIRRWDASSGALQGTLEGHGRSVEAIALAPDGSQLASVSSDNTARVWDVRTGRVQQVLTGHKDRVVDVQFSSDGADLLTGSIDHTIRLWRIADGRCLQIQDHVDPIASVSLLNGGKFLLAADRGGSVHVWQRKTALALPSSRIAPLHSWKAHQGRAWGLAALPRKLGVVTAGADGKIRYWQRPAAPERSLQVAPHHTIADFALEAGSTRVHLIDVSPDQQPPIVRTWNTASSSRSPLKDQTASSSLPSDTVVGSTLGRRPAALCMLPGQLLVLHCADSTIEGVDASSGKSRFRFQLPWPEQLGHSDDVAVSGDGSRLAVFSYENDKTVVLDLTQNRVLGTFKAYAHSMALSADGKQLAMSDGDDVVVWDVDRHEQVARLKGHTSTVSTLRFHPTGRFLASGSHDRQVRLWAFQGDAAPLVLAGHRADVNTVAFSPDGRLLASGDGRGELILWFVATATELVSIESTEPIKSLEFSAKGDRLAVQNDRQITVLTGCRDETGDIVTSAGQ